MVVDLASQHAFVYRGGKLIGIATISSGRPGHATPDGTYTVLEKEKMHHSNKYDDAPMPFMERLTWDGLALHGGHPRGWPASHGCIRMPMGFAAALFKEDTRGMQVVITGDAPSKAEVLAAQENARANACCDRSAATSYPTAPDYSWVRDGTRAGPAIPSAAGECGAGDDGSYASPASAESQPGSCGNGEGQRPYDPDEYAPSDVPSPPN